MLLTVYLFFLISKTKHPLIICLILVISSAQVGFFLNKAFRKWLFYLIVLLFLGGIIVLFIYIASLARNRKPVLSQTDLFLGGLAFLIFYIGGYGLGFTRFLVSPSSVGGLYSWSGGLTIALLISYLLILLVVCLRLVGKRRGRIKNLF